MSKNKKLPDKCFKNGLNCLYLTESTGYCRDSCKKAKDVKQCDLWNNDPRDKDSFLKWRANRQGKWYMLLGLMSCCPEATPSMVIKKIRLLYKEAFKTKYKP